MNGRSIGDGAALPFLAENRIDVAGAGSTRSTSPPDERFFGLCRRVVGCTLVLNETLNG
jgi:hypothetical protein